MKAAETEFLTIRKGNIMNGHEDSDVNILDLQWATVEVEEPEPGTLRNRTERDGETHGQFSSARTLEKFPVCRTVLSKLNGTGHYSGTALINHRKRLVFDFYKEGEELPSPIPQLYVGEQWAAIPSRVRGKVPLVNGAVVGARIKPAARRPGMTRKRWVADDVVELTFDNPRLIKRMVEGAPFRPYALPFLEDYVAFIHGGPGIDSRERQYHEAALQAISESSDLNGLRDWAEAELQGLRSNNDRSHCYRASRPSASNSPSRQTTSSGTEDGRPEDAGRRHPTSGIPVTKLDLDEGSSNDA